MKPKIFFTAIITSLILFLSCQDNAHKENTFRKIAYDIDTLNISVDSTSENFYFTFHNFYKNSNEFIAYYNGHRHSIDIANLDNQKLENIISLDKEGENAVIRPTSIFIISSDSIWIYSNYTQALKLIDAHGRVLKSYNLSNIKTVQGNVGDLLADYNFPLQYDKHTGNLFFYNIYSGDIPKSIASNVVATFNIRSAKLSLLPLGYSDYYISEKGEFGNFWNASLSIVDNKLIYNFQAESGIYTSDLLGNSQSSYKADSKFTKNQVSPYRANEDGERHGIENPTFFRVLYDPYRNLYYRFHWGGIPHKDINGRINTFSDKPLFLMVLDENFNVLHEMKMPEQTYAVYTWFVSSKGLCINSGNAILKNANQEEGKMVIHIYKFKVKNSS
jgi:hypothetical protein